VPVSATNIPTDTLREAFEASGLTKHELARRLGWWRTVPNMRRVSQILGVGCPKQTTVTYDTALEVCKALDLDPVDMGL